MHIHTYVHTCLRRSKTNFIIKLYVGYEHVSLTKNPRCSPRVSSAITCVTLLISNRLLWFVLLIIEREYHYPKGAPRGTTFTSASNSCSSSSAGRSLLKQMAAALHLLCRVQHRLEFVGWGEPGRCDICLGLIERGLNQLSLHMVVVLMVGDEMRERGNQ
jgi:hypothetical protein